MRVLGPAIITWTDQRNMRRNGYQHLIVRRDKVFADAAERAQPGDCWWVKEPFFDVRSPQFGCPEFHEIIIGYGPWRFEVPAHVQPHRHIARWQPKDAAGLRRGESLAYLQIVEEVSKPVQGWLCRVYLKNVDAAMKVAA